MRKLLFKVSIFSLAVMYLGVAVWLYWTLYPYKTIDYLNDPFPTNPAEPIAIKQGETFTYHMHYCKSTDNLPVKITKEFVDGIIFQAPDQKALITEAGCGDRDIPVQIPKNLPPGKYRLRLNVVYKVNPIREIIKTSETQEFIVQER